MITATATSTALRIPAGYRLATDADELPNECPLCGKDRYHDLSDYSFYGYGHDGEWVECGCPDVVEDEDWEPEPDPDPTEPAALPAAWARWDDVSDADLFDLMDGLAA